jgi:hypothetical protein
MKLADIEDSDKLVTRDLLEVALGRFQNHVDERFNAVDARITGLEGKINGFDARLNTVQRSIWFLIVVVIGQVCATFGPLIWKVYHP